MAESEINKLKDQLKKERKLKRKYHNTVKKAENLFEAIQPQIDVFEHFKGAWTTLPVIPQDLGFEEIEERREGSPVMRIYHRDGFAMTKMLSGRWMIAKDDIRAEFKLRSKFDAYHILKALGMEFDEDE